MNNNNGIQAKQQIYGSLLEKNDEFSLPRVPNRSTLEKKPDLRETAMSGASSNFVAQNRKYSLDNGNLGNIEKSRFIGLGM